MWGRREKKKEERVWCSPAMKVLSSDAAAPALQDDLGVSVTIFAIALSVGVSGVAKSTQDEGRSVDLASHSPLFLLYNSVCIMTTAFDDHAGYSGHFVLQVCRRYAWRLQVCDENKSAYSMDTVNCSLRIRS